MTDETNRRAHGSQEEKGLRIDILPLKKAALLLRSISHPLRQSILETLHHNEGITVTELYRKLSLDQSITSQQLAILRRAGFVLTRRKGRHIYYSVNYQRIHTVQVLAHELLN